MSEQDNQKLAADLVKSLGLQHPPLLSTSARKPCLALNHLTTKCRQPPPMAVQVVYQPVAFSG